VRCHVRQRRAVHNISDGIISIHAGFIEIIHHHFAFFSFNANLFQSNAFDIGGNAHCREYNIGFDGFLAFFGLHTHLAFLARGIYFGYFR